jgi:hypothetical protein
MWDPQHPTILHASTACYEDSFNFFTSAYFSSMKMESACSSETSADVQRTTRRYMAADSTLFKFFNGCNWMETINSNWLLRYNLIMSISAWVFTMCVVWGRSACHIQHRKAWTMERLVSMKVTGFVCLRHDSLSVKQTACSLGQCSAQVRGSNNPEARQCPTASGYLIAFVQFTRFGALSKGFPLNYEAHLNMQLVETR